MPEVLEEIQSIGIELGIDIKRISFIKYKNQKQTESIESINYELNYGRYLEQ